MSVQGSASGDCREPIPPESLRVMEAVSKGGILGHMKRRLVEILCTLLLLAVVGVLLNAGSTPHPGLDAAYERSLSNTIYGSLERQGQAR